ncbi:MAG: hypothetical protein M1822_008772 [Bathelium mastoideum]|nr:MAG: hypothetical protein M1822_008772 [Bathelium mastoideum]
MPAFSFRHIKDLYPIFWGKAREAAMAMMMEPRASYEHNEKALITVEINNWAARATLDIIGTAGMGHDFNSIQNPDGELAQVYRTIFDPGNVGRALQLIGFFLPLWFLRRLPVQRNTDMQQAAVTIKQVCLQLVQDKRRRIEKGERTEHDIISVAIESGGFSDDDLVNQNMTFLAAGHETTASAMTWAVYLLCQNPAVQTRLREEIRGSLPRLEDQSKPISSTNIDSLPYLNAVCNEVLRFYPPVPSTMRQAADDTTILGNPIPKGTMVIITPWAINQSTKLWGPDARTFNPDRWIDPATGHANNTGGADSNFSFLTFLHGPRSCIGQAFAKAEFACLLAAWVGRFEMELADPNQKIDIKGGITARPKGGLVVRLRPLEGW